MSSERIPYSGNLALGRVPRDPTKCVTESKRLRSRPDSRDRRARCSGDHEVICWAPKSARVPGQYSRCGCVLLARPPPHKPQNVEGYPSRDVCELPGFTFGIGRTLTERRLGEPCASEFLKLLVVRFVYAMYMLCSCPVVVAMCQSVSMCSCLHWPCARSCALALFLPLARLCPLSLR